MERMIFEVHTLNQKIKSLLESDFSLCGISVKGEVTSLNKHYTGHYYFKLRDDDGSLLSVTMFSSYTKYAPADLKNGDQVIITGSINVYVQGGTYSFNARKIEIDGLGNYLLELKKLEEKLSKEGLFTKEKRKIPFLPKRIGVLTASSGAAIHDVTSTILKRCGTEVLVFPCAVQGKDAPLSMVKTLKKAYEYDLDLLILTRGGGSKDDLYAFNDEELVRTLAFSPCPTITAVGHSIDTTLVDKVSDLSCITPTEAGTFAVKEKSELSYMIDTYLSKAYNQLLINLTSIEQRLIANIEKLNASSPINVLNLTKKSIESYVNNLDYLMFNKLELLKNKFNICNSKLLFPHYKLEKNSIILKETSSKIDNKMIDIINKHKLKLDSIINEIEAMSPTNLLLKGYSFVYNKDKNLIKSIDDASINEELIVEVIDGYLYTTIKEKRNK